MGDSHGDWHRRGFGRKGVDLSKKKVTKMGWPSMASSSPSLLSAQEKYILTNTQETTEKETLIHVAYSWKSVI